MFNYVKNNYNYYFDYDRYYDYNNYKNKYVDVKLKNKIYFEGELIKIKKTNIDFYNIETCQLTFIIYVKKNINIEYTIEINNILEIKCNKKNEYKLLLDELFEKSYFFKNLDIYLKKSIKDFLYISNND